MDGAYRTAAFGRDQHGGQKQAEAVGREQGGEAHEEERRGQRRWAAPYLAAAGEKCESDNGQSGARQRGDPRADMVAVRPRRG